MHKLHARIVKDCIFLYYTVDAGMVELVDTRDLKSLDGKMSCRFDSGSRHTALHIRGAFYLCGYPLRLQDAAFLAGQSGLSAACALFVRRGMRSCRRGGDFAFLQEIQSFPNRLSVFPAVKR